VAPATVAQRIVRAKAKIRDARLPYQVPGRAELPGRLDSVLRVVYLVFNEGYWASSGPALTRPDLSGEAIRLGRLLVEQLPEPEAIGLLALMLLHEARRAARTSPAGELVLLEDQDRALWNRELIAEGLALVSKALRLGRPGPYQVQATISAVHARAVRARDTNWAEIERLYAALEGLQPSPVVTLNHAVAVAKVRGPAAALEMIEPLGEWLDGYFNFFGVKGALLLQLGRSAEALIAFDRAIALANTPAEAAHIRLHLDRLVKESAATAAQTPA
jgi:RNA polymerase sigma-70 factor (ECF subfamily)